MPLIDKAIWHIETDLRATTDLAQLASHCAVSPWHLSRVFRTTTGTSPMAYLRARRLTEAAKALAYGPDDILNVALDFGYGSHEAFSRAFAAHFGKTPRYIRQNDLLNTLSLQEPFKMTSTKFVPVETARIEEIGPRSVLGMAVKTTFENAANDIPPLWNKFNAHMGEIPTTNPKASYGVCLAVDPEAGQFTYLAGVEVTENAKTSTDMEKVDIPAGKYAVFTHKGHISEIGNTTFSIWNKALEEQSLTHRPAPDFERYDQRFDPKSGRGPVEIWIPIT